MRPTVRGMVVFCSGVVMAGVSSFFLWHQDEPVEPDAPKVTPTAVPSPTIGISPDEILRIPSSPMVNRVEESSTHSTREIVREPTPKRTPRDEPEPTNKPPEDGPDIELPVDVPDIEIPDVELPDPLPDIDLPDLPKLP